MKTTLILCVALVVLFNSYMWPEVKNSDKPLKGDWDFQLKKIWSANSAGEDVMARPRQLLAADDGTVFLYDRTNMKFFIFNSEGKFVKSFGISGEGPGEIKRFYNARLLNDMLVVVDVSEIEFYSKDGTAVKSVRNDYTKRIPDYFINETECIYFPLLAGRDLDIQGKIYRYDFKTNKETVIAEFPIHKAGYASDGTRAVLMVAPAITPIITVGYDTDRLYYALNNEYEINVIDYNGKKIDKFSLDRKRVTTDLKAKREFVKKGPLPLQDDMIDNIAKSFPDDLTFFTRLDVIDKLVYAYVSHFAYAVERQQVDIFSPDGKYLYRGVIYPGDGKEIITGPFPLIFIKNGFLYMSLENQDGEVTLEKYKIELPKS